MDNLPSSLATVSEHEAAAITGFSVKALQNRRYLGKSPTFLKVGRLIRYRLSDLEEFLNNSTVQPREEENA